METIKIVNLIQASLYIKHGLKPIDIYWGHNDRLIFLFKKDETKPLFDLWCKHELR